MNRLNDSRVKKYLVLDVETIGVDNRSIFDIGFIICDKKGNKFIKRSYLVKEIFLNMDLMRKAYYFNKYPSYLEGLGNGSFIIKPWSEILEEMYSLIKEFDIQVISAYNLSFDLSALKYTNNYIREREFKLFDDIEKLCIWGLATETICQQKTYKRQVYDKGLLTASQKFLSSSAETVYKYMSQKWDFEESHTGLQDCEIEVDIMAKAFRQNKKISRGIVPAPYRLLKV